MTRTFRQLLSRVGGDEMQLVISTQGKEKEKKKAGRIDLRKNKRFWI